MATQSKVQRPVEKSELDSRWWLPGTGPQKKKWRCLACESATWFEYRKAQRHEHTQGHEAAVQRQLRKASMFASTSTAPPPRLGVSPHQVVGPLAALLRDVNTAIDDAEPHQTDSSYYDQEHDPADTHPSTERRIDWSTVSSQLGGTIAVSHTQAALSALTNRLDDWILGGEDADSESDSEPAEYEEPQADDDVRHAARAFEVPDPLAAGTRRTRNTRSDPQWYPWPDKQTCVLDILRHLPRSLFSDHQMEIILWAMDVLGVDQRPSLFVLKTIDKMLQDLCGIPTIRQKGPLGHVYYSNDLAAILAQEIANPRIRPHMHFYPEDSGSTLKECWQASRWLRELSPELATPMVRVGSQDYYVYEPAKLVDGRTLIPFRWFTRASGQGSNRVQKLYGEGWRLDVTPCGDGRRGYIVREDICVTFAVSSLSLSLPLLKQTWETDGLPDPQDILGRYVSGDAGLHAWAYTDAAVGNLWRARALKNDIHHRVVSMPMWLYCDDTSGNMSKKWNKHNSWLFTVAGLPRALAQQEANVHFLSTSNSAPPLEMLHGIVGQLEKGQTEGFWAWDVVEQEMVLIIPVVLAVLGDNPMQSEIACHIGLAGKFFCRNCMVYGQEPPEDPAEKQAGGRARSRAASVVSEAESAESDGSAGSPEPKGRRKETLQELVDRARRFLAYSEPRTKDKTLQALEQIFKEASTTGGMSRSKKMKTNTGVKDTFQEFFSDRIFSFGRKLRGRKADKQALLDLFVADNLPTDIISPVWRIRDLDPHQDTPVEILHVVLLGFIKYFWRDVIARLSTEKKTLLKTRLSSVDVSGLGFAPLSGETLVTYAGSLTGRDFRAISQVAPFVLQGLGLPEPCYDAWVALSALVPLIWQPEIRDLEAHLNVLQRAIDYFLDCTARWTPRWFNKPKFHILRHLVPHIRRFGPAVLFATEGFESFNAVVRGKSVHSNRQAPSRDIAYAFARANRTRHLLSGGVFQERPRSAAGDIDSEGRDSCYNDDPATWRSAGPLPLALASIPRYGTRDVIAPLLSDDACMTEPIAGACELASDQPVPIEATLTASYAPSWKVAAETIAHRCTAVLDHDGSRVLPGSWVIFQDPRTDTAPGSSSPCLVGRVAEILQLSGSAASLEHRADVLLIEGYRCTGFSPAYQSPTLRSNGWAVVPGDSVLCSVNVQHNCAAHACTDSGKAPTWAERERAAPRAAMSHREPGDLVLNTFQMRSAKIIQQFRYTPDPLDREQAIMIGAVTEIESQKAAAGKTGSRTKVKTTALVHPTAISSSLAALRSPSSLSQTTVAPQPLR